jgi:hypothetical protein
MKIKSIGRRGMKIGVIGERRRRGMGIGITGGDKEGESAEWVDYFLHFY